MATHVTPPAPSFRTIPPDLWLRVFAHCDRGTKISLGATNYVFRHRLHHDVPFRAETKTRALKQLQQPPLSLSATEATLFTHALRAGLAQRGTHMPWLCVGARAKQAGHALQRKLDCHPHWHEQSKDPLWPACGSLFRNGSELDRRLLRGAMLAYRCCTFVGFACRGARYAMLAAQVAVAVGILVAPLIDPVCARALPNRAAGKLMLLLSAVSCFGAALVDMDAGEKKPELFSWAVAGVALTLMGSMATMDLIFGLCTKVGTFPDHQLRAIAQQQRASADMFDSLHLEALVRMANALGASLDRRRLFQLLELAQSPEELSDRYNEVSGASDRGPAFLPLQTARGPVGQGRL